MPPSPPAPSDTLPAPSAMEIRKWLVNRLSGIQNVDPAEIRLNEPLIDMGLDSMRSVVLIGELEQWLGCRFTDNPLLVYPTIETLSVYLADQLARGKQLIDPKQR